MENAAAKLADGMVVVPRGQLVMGGTLAKVGGVHRARRRECFECPIDGASRKTRFRFVELGRYLFRRAVAAEPHDGVVDHGPLRRAPHARGQHQEGCTTRRLRSELVSTRQPSASRTTSSSIRTPPQPGM